MAYSAIAGSEIDADSPITAGLMTKLRDNPEAIALGLSGATRIVDAALDTGAATSAGTAWVNLRIAGGAAGAVGTYAFLMRTTATISSPGDTVAGSSLDYCGVYEFLSSTESDSVLNDVSTSPSGTWRCMGTTGFLERTATLWLRIS